LLTTRHPLSAKAATSGGLSVAVVRSRTEATEIFFIVRFGNRVMDASVGTEASSKALTDDASLFRAVFHSSLE
jgi:hypothetical protein